jgi:hypothetical protein
MENDENESELRSVVDLKFSGPAQSESNNNNNNNNNNMILKVNPRYTRTLK